MATLIVGTGAALSFAGMGAGLQVAGYSFTIVNPTEPSTVFDSKNYASFQAVGGIHMVVSVDILIDAVSPFAAAWLANPASLTACAGAFTLTLKAGVTFAGTGVLQSASPVRSEVGIAKMNVQFISSGVITMAW